MDPVPQYVLKRWIEETRAELTGALVFCSVIIGASIIIAAFIIR